MLSRRHAASARKRSDEPSPDLPPPTPRNMLIMPRVERAMLLRRHAAAAFSPLPRRRRFSAAAAS